MGHSVIDNTGINPVLVESNHVEAVVDTPSIPILTKKNILFYSVFTIIWWVAIWGISETIVHHYVRNSFPHRIAIYSGMIFLVFCMMLVYPDLIEYL